MGSGKRGVGGLRGGGGRWGMGRDEEREGGREREGRFSDLGHSLEAVQLHGSVPPLLPAYKLSSCEKFEWNVV